MRIAAYISAHGFGHLAQIAPVLNRIYQLEPDCQFLIRCALPEVEIEARLDFPFDIESTPVDVGVVQKSAIEEDRPASELQMKHWISEMDMYIEREIRLLRDFQPSLVLSDISPLAFPAARALSIPGIGIATLDWHTIYSHWLPENDPTLTSLAAAYHDCDLLLEPPMAMDMAVFPKRQKISLIAAYPSEIKPPLLKRQSKKALVIFGGSGQPSYDLQALAAMDEWQFLIPDAPAETPGNVQNIHFNSKMRPVDVMPFVDVVVCKPGYGALAECWRTGTPIAWVERPDFPEFPILKSWLNSEFPSCGMSISNFKSGSWLDTLEAARTHAGSFPKLAADGAEAAADIILGFS
jgi:hypothetical protein